MHTRISQQPSLAFASFCACPASVSYTHLDFFLYQSTVLFYVSILLLTRFSYAMEHFQIYFFLVLLGFAINASVILILWTMARFPKLYVKISRGIVNVGFRFHIVKNKACLLYTSYPIGEPEDGYEFRIYD